MLQAKPRATIQVDLDGLWTNLKYYGHNVKTSPDPILESAIPRFLELFRRYNVKATFFVIGKDLEDPRKRKIIETIHKEGHELANHTYSHPFGLRKLSRKEKKEEIHKCEKLIKNITKEKTLGFKAPGYDMDTELLEVLEDEQYLYDSSMIPTFIYPFVMRLYYYMGKGVKRTHGPKVSWALAPNTIYRPSKRSEIKRAKKGILEFPCSVIPLIRVPFHTTFAFKFGMIYFNIGYWLVKIFRLPLNYEFHAVDLADKIEESKIAHMSGTPLNKRMRICEEIVKKISADYTVITSKDFLEARKKNA